MDWSTTTGFRPEGPVDLVKVESNGALQVYPNPFTAGFSVALEGAGKDKVYILNIYDMLGRSAYSTEGTLAGMNRFLKSLAVDWSPGAYIMELRSKEEGLIHRWKLVKY